MFCFRKLRYVIHRLKGSIYLITGAKEQGNMWKKVEDDEIILMNGIKTSKKERSYSNEAAEHQVPEKEQSNEQEKKTKDLESPSGFSTMSPLQKFFFVASLLLSVMYVVAFAWLIPCNVLDNNDNNNPIIVTEQWRLNFSEIGITTSLKLTKALGNGSALLFGYERIEGNELVGGIMSIHGDEGKLLWQKKLPFVPRFLSCDTLDLDFDDIMECVIVGDNGSVAMLNHATEDLVWLNQNKDYPAYEMASIPAVIPDCDKDNTQDLAVAYSEYTSSDGGRFPVKVTIGILSGRTGEMIGSRKPITECISAVNKLQLWRRDMISSDILFYCNDNEGFGNFWKIPTNKLCNKSEDTTQLNFIKAYRIDQPQYSSFNVLYQPVQKLYSSDENMLVAWKDGNIILLNADDDIPVWSHSFNTSAEIRALLTGKFTNESDNQVALISSDQTTGSMLGVLQIETGYKIMSTLYPKYFLTEAIPIRNMFSETDGILVKHIKVKSKVTVKESYMQNSSSNSLDKFVVREEYLISHPGCTDRESLKFVASDKVTKFLHQNSTFENRIETNQVTAAVRSAKAEDSLELFTASISSDKNDASQDINKLTTVKLLHLSHVLFSKNNTCECSC